MTLPRAHAHWRAGVWPVEVASGSVTLCFDDRHRRRIVLMTDDREEVLLDLSHTVAMADGDGLQLDDGRWLRVRAAWESVVEVTHDDPAQLARFAWHIGNRHIPAEIRESALLVRPDHVIEEMLQGLGATLVRMSTVFQPERGAYAGHVDHHHE